MHIKKKQRFLHTNFKRIKKTLTFGAAKGVYYKRLIYV